jgi:hypothetical protein
VCDSLVESGHAVRIESDDFDGVGYQLSAEMAETHRRVIDERADETAMNWWAQPLQRKPSFWRMTLTKTEQIEGCADAPAGTTAGVTRIGHRRAL